MTRVCVVLTSVLLNAFGMFVVINDHAAVHVIVLFCIKDSRCSFLVITLRVPATRAGLRAHTV